MIWQISIAVIALAFLALVIFLILTLLSLRKSLQVTNQTLEDLHIKMQDLSDETVKMIRSSNEIAIDIHEKIKAFDPLFRSIHNVSESVEEATDAFKKITSSTTHRVTEHHEKSISPKQEKIAQVVEWALLGVGLWQKFLSRR